MVPYAAEMALWLRRERHYIAMSTEAEKGVVGSLTNPYSYNASTLFGIIASTISTAVDFIESVADMPSFDAEAQRIRLQNELALTSARFCEATIKQMLFCTSIPHKLYKNRSLGQLLAMDCKDCRKAKRVTHDYSLLGALAHQYFQCHILEGCAYDHLALVNRRRNNEAAHSSLPAMRLRSVSASREDLRVYLDESIAELLHILGHIGDIETAMMREIELFISHRPNLPPLDELMQIPSRPRSLEGAT